ncbi:hypothetical protein BX600DRAFT_471169 [Xylariales sp. PMI_506]|nr:hypothetical protein BX600DRAFT_471169 [Xylariales sp. PMI_506]
MLRNLVTPIVLLVCSPFFSGANGHQIHAEDSLVIRAAECGAGVGSCPSGSCCNKSGQCGTDHTFCGGAGNCQIDYSDSCEEQKIPSGPSLIDLPRPKLGSVPYGQIIKSCSKPGTIALAFDDGPAKNYTSKILDLLRSYDMKATFFVTGHDFAQPIDDPDVEYGAVLQRIHAEGHQIGHHTWTHENLTTLNDTRLTNQMHYNEMALRNVLGFIPTYMRPPYLSCKNNCPTIVGDLGYHIITANLDTKDFDNNSPDLIQQSKDAFTSYFQNNVTDASASVVLTLNHDIRLQTAYNLTDFMLNYIVQNNLPKSVTIGECMDDPPENWYRDAGGPLISTTGTATAGGSDSTPSATGTASSGTSSKPNSAATILLSQELLALTAAVAVIMSL